MAKNYWLLTTGTGDWGNTANWSLGAVPVSTNDVEINQGNASITTTLNQSAVTLASLTIGPNFSGTIGSTATPFPAPLQIGVSGNVVINTASSQMSLNFGSTTPTVLVLNTGSPSSSAIGSESLQLMGGGSGATLAVTGANTSVGIATQYLGQASTFTSASIEAGTLNIGAGVTITNIYQAANGSNNGGTLTVLCAATLLQQSGTSCTAYTLGTGEIATITVAGTLVAGHRTASGVSSATITVGPGATFDASQNPEPFTVTNAVVLYSGSTFTMFGAAQIQTSGPSALQFTLEACSLSDVTINTGSPCVVTVTT